MIFAITPGPTHVALVLQSQYVCPTKQSGWVRQAPIKFGVKLVNAANPGYLGILGHDEQVLNYDGVGSTITCRLNVRGTVQTPSTCRFIFPF